MVENAHSREKRDAATATDAVTAGTKHGGWTRFATDLYTRGRAADVGAILAVPVVLLVLFALPRPAKFDLTLAYGQPTLRTAFLSHFVHLRTPHLVSNLVGYAVVVPLCYTVAVLADRRKDFLVAFVAILLSFPFALSALNVLFPRPRIGYGFSGIVMAFLGLFTLLWWSYVAVRGGLGLGRDVSPVAFFLGTALIAAWEVPGTRVGLIVVGLAAAGTLYYLGPWGDGTRLEVIQSVSLGPGYFDIAVLGLIVVVSFPLLGFVSAPADGGVLTNEYSHVLGYCLGYLVPYTTFRAIGVTVK